jgi:molybdopterin molybdotransferase
MYDIGFDRALDLALRNMSPTGSEIAPASELVGRVCAQDVIALADYPSADSSLKDGYAVVSQDLEPANVSSPVVLQVIGAISAGGSSAVTVHKGTAVRVLSGAPIPGGADAVLAEEFAEVGPGEIRALACAEQGRNILSRGGEITRGEVLVRAGQVLTPSKISLVVAGGLERISVFRRPVVGLLATGDEVLLPGRPPEPGKLFASNVSLQQAWLRSWSIDANIGLAGDSFDDLTAAVESMLSDCDVLLTSGGAWKGDRDLVVKVLDTLGWDRVFHRVRIGPGKAVGMGILRAKPIFCLPGGPPSNEVAFLMIAFPAVLRMSGHKSSPYLHLTGILEQDVGGDEDWTQVIHCRAEKRDASIRLTPLDRRRRLKSMAKADGLVLVPEGVQLIPAGSSVEFICLTNGFAEI